MHLNYHLLSHAETVLTTLLQFQYPADATLSRYFREYPKLGHADRAFIAETCYAVLRRRRSLAARCAGEPTPHRLLLAALHVVRGIKQSDLAMVLRGRDAPWLVKTRDMDLSGESLAVQLDLPDWLCERLLQQHDAAGVSALATAFNRPAPLDVRLNPLNPGRLDRAALAAELQASGMQTTPGSLSPWALRLTGKPALAKHPRFLDGSFEVQDEGSQLLGFLVAPKRSEMVADFCAGAGGKTLLLGAMMRSTGRLYAFDVAEKRLAKLKPRLARSGLSNVHPVRIDSEHDSKLKRMAGKFDRVLVDAPCSGLGTLRRNPDLKWRQTPESVAELVEKQQSILTAAARLVRPGGRLVYATCSLLPEENDGVVDAFLAAHPEFTVRSAEAVLAQQDIALACGERLHLDPITHGCDAFFAAVLERSPAPGPAAAD